MSDEFAKAKRRVSDKFLGNSAVHGVGIHADAENTIAVYRERSKDETSAETEAIAESIRQEASPFNVEIVDEESTVMHPAGEALGAGLGAAVPAAEPLSAGAADDLSAAVAAPDDMLESHRGSDGTAAREKEDGDHSEKE